MLICYLIGHHYDYEYRGGGHTHLICTRCGNWLPIEVSVLDKDGVRQMKDAVERVKSERP